MKPRQHVIVFLRAPRLGALKRRLARDIGHRAALNFYRAASTSVLRRLLADPRWTVWLSVTPDGLARPGRAWPAVARRRLRTMPQGRGDLGQRMLRALGTPPRGKAVVIGSDIPEIASGHIAAAFRALGRNDIVFGPAGDGGYWLIGMARNRAPLWRRDDLLTGVRWSSAHALADSQRRLGRYRVGLLDQLDDVDSAADLTAWRRRLGSRRRRSDRE